MGELDRVKVDILILAYNEEKFLDLCLRFLKKQRLLNKIILIDDFSTDNTVKIAKKLNIEVLKAQKPLEQRETLRTENLNYGLKFITTKYFMRVDADYVLLKDYIYHCVKYIIGKEKYFSVSGVGLPIYPKWNIIMNSVYSIYPRGGARLYDTEKLKKIGGFQADPKPRLYKRRGIYLRTHDDAPTDKIAAQFNYFKGITRKAKAWHLRPIKDHIELNLPNRYEKMFFLLLYFRFKKFYKGIEIIKRKIQRSNFKELLSTMKVELKSLLVRLFFRVIESEENRYWLKIHLGLDFSDVRF